MNKYVIRFSKTGYIKYTSHLDMLRLFKRSFKKNGIALEYSHGFNPHPKMGFAQPLSLGYTSTCELLEFETGEPYETAELLQKLRISMPAGIEIKSCQALGDEVKSLAAAVETATYVVVFPLKSNAMDFTRLLEDYLSQKEIMAWKRQKKTKQLKEVNIRDKIQFIRLLPAENLTLSMQLACGSRANLSPELVISSFLAFAGISTKRQDIEVERVSLGFGNNLQFLS